MSAVERFPELADFELELELNGRWSTCREDEHEIAKHVLNDITAVRSMLGGLVRYVDKDGERTACRLTPKAWLRATRSASEPREG